MTLIRRCDGCGNDIVYNPKELDNYFTMKAPPPKSGLRIELEFHTEECLEQWLHREHR